MDQLSQYANRRKCRPEFFERLIKFALKNKILVCHDNPYTFILNPRPVNIFQVQGAMDCVLELTSCSKTTIWQDGA